MNRSALLDGLRDAGLNVDAGLERLNGDFPLYLQVLKRFIHDDALGMSRLRELLEAGRYEEARILAHTLRGTTAVIGAAELSASLHSLEDDIIRRIGGGETGKGEAFDRAESLFSALTGGLGDLDIPETDGDGPGSPSLSSDEWTRQLAELREYIDLQQPRECRELLKNLLSSAPDDRVGKGLQDLDRFIQGYRFDEALERIGVLMAERQKK